MEMKKAAFAFVLVASACTPDVELELETPDPEVLPAYPIDEDLPPVGELAWVDTNLENRSVQFLEWAPDGTLIAGGWTALGMSSHPDQDSFVAKLGADGAPLWRREIRRDDLLEVVEECCDFEPGEVEILQTFATIGAIDVYQDGQVVVAVDGKIHMPGDSWAYFAFLRWYGRDGELLATRSFPATASGGPITNVSSVLALPDGGTVLGGGTGSTGTDGSLEPIGTLVARLDPGREIVWTTPVDNAGLWSVREVNYLTAMPDGGIAFQGVFGGEVTVGGCSASFSSGLFVARLDDQDGRCIWLRDFEFAGQLPSNGGLALAPGGNLIAAGSIGVRVRAGDLELLPDPNGENWYFLSELAADGTVVSLNKIGRLPQVLTETNKVDHWAMSVVGDTIATAGLVQELKAVDWEAGIYFRADSAFVALFSRSGDLRAARRIEPPTLTEEDASLAMAVALRPEGGVAVGGGWGGSVDFGDGTVVEGGGAFIVMYDLEDDPAVDLARPRP